MPQVMEAIDKMTAEERVQTMEYLWEVMTAEDETEPPAWHKDILAERRRMAESGEAKFIPWEEAKRQLLEEFA